MPVCIPSAHLFVMEADDTENLMDGLNNRTASDMLEDAIQHFDDIIDKTGMWCTCICACKLSQIS